MTLYRRASCLFHPSLSLFFVLIRHHKSYARVLLRFQGFIQQPTYFQASWSPSSPISPARNPSQAPYFKMYSDIDIRKQNGTLPMHTDPLASPSRQQQGGRNSLLERLKPDTPHRGRRPADITSKEQEYLDVTAAFFGRHRRQAPQAQNSGYQDSSPLKRPQQQQKPLNPPVEPRSLGSPSANGLRTELDRTHFHANPLSHMLHLPAKRPKLTTP